MEGAFQIATGQLRSLSEQQLIDCAGGAYGNKGCSGGNFDGAYNYIMNNSGLDSEQDYPYQGQVLGCWKQAATRNVAAIASFKDVTPNNEAQLVAAVALGPVAVAVEADQPMFQSYKVLCVVVWGSTETACVQSGVMGNSSCGTKLDHGVLIVGYTADAWIVKNSWGGTWGDKVPHSGWGVLSNVCVGLRRVT